MTRFVGSPAISPTMRNLLLALLLVCPTAWADSWVGIVNGPSWHATSDPLNWRTFGVGIGYSHGSWTGAIGSYKNSNYDRSIYLGVQYLHPLGEHWVYGGELAIVTGYIQGWVIPIPVSQIGYRMGNGILLIGVIPPSGVSPAVINAQLQFNL